MKTNIDLSGLTVWLARPQETGAALANTLQQHGATVLHIPSLVPQALDYSKQSEAALMHIPKRSLLIFTSQYAVWFSQYYLSHLLAQKAHYIIAAIGKKTALALKAQGLSPHIVPNQTENSESLLALLELHLSDFETVYLIQGKVHRDFLQKTLENHGKNVKSIVVYQQGFPKMPAIDIQSALKQKKLNALIAGSFLSIENCLRLVGSALTRDLLSVPLFVISERIQTLALRLGFQTVQLAPIAKMDDMLDLLHTQKETLCKNLKP